VVLVVCADLFKEIIPSILETKKDCLDDEKSYSPFMVNRALSYQIDCLFYANAMNCMHELDKRPQYDYLMRAIRKQKRPFVSWSKPNKSEYISAVMWNFDYSRLKAMAVLKVLSKEELEEIRDLYRQMHPEE